MKIIIAGGTGFIGRFLVNHYLDQKHEVTVIGRDLGKITRIFNHSVSALTWDALAIQGATNIASADVVINLTGVSIGDRRWTDKQKELILSSRVEPTRVLARLCAQLGAKAPPLFHASGVGTYGLQLNLASGLPPALDEQTDINLQEASDFLSQVGRQCELATESAIEAGVRVVHLRFGAVLGKNGGVLAKLKWPFLFFLGGDLGSGQQAFSWVAMPDLQNAVDFLIQHTEINGPVNVVAPLCVTQHQFALALARVLQRPSFMLMPAFMVKFLFGQMGDELLLHGQHVKPGVLLEHGFKFQYPDIDSTLNYAFNRRITQ